ncbi:hypothetical protein B0H11DRAFT_2185754, partial [Mycena galericulata]
AVYLPCCPSDIQTLSICSKPTRRRHSQSWDDWVRAFCCQIRGFEAPNAPLRALAGQ